jgi:hypothetical protein
MAVAFSEKKRQNGLIVMGDPTFGCSDPLFLFVDPQRTIGVSRDFPLTSVA